MRALPPAPVDDADASHAMVSLEMLQRNDGVILSSVGFYSPGNRFCWNGRYNNLAPGSYYADAPHIFLTDPKFLALWQGGGYFCLCHRNISAGRKRGQSVYANRPATSVAASQ